MTRETQFEGDTQFLRLCQGAVEVDLVALLLEFAADADLVYSARDCAQQILELGLECRRHLRGLTARLARDGVIPKLAFGGDESPDKLTPPPDLSQLTVEQVRPLLAALCRYFHDRLGFTGNLQEYYAPENSYLPTVLAERKGIPITLAILFRELAAACGIPLFGVGTPGHFALGYAAVGDEPLFVDAFTAETLTRAELRAKVERLTGEPLWRDDVFEPASHLAIAARVLRNLKGAYARLENWEAALRVQQRLAALLPELSDEQRDLGLLLVRTGQPRPALTILESYVQHRPQEAESLEPFIRAARRMVAQWN